MKLYVDIATTTTLVMVDDERKEYTVLENDGRKICRISREKAEKAWDNLDSFEEFWIDVENPLDFQYGTRQDELGKVLFGEFYQVYDEDFKKEEALNKFIQFLKDLHRTERGVVGLKELSHLSLFADAYLICCFEYAGKLCESHIPPHWEVLAMMKEVLIQLLDSCYGDTSELEEWLDVVQSLLELEMLFVFPEEDDTSSDEDVEVEMINLTPHTINFVLEDGSTKAIPTSGTIARVSVENVPDGMIGGIPVTRAVYGEVENLPEPKKNTIYIVSSLVAQHCPDRQDLFIPNDSVRDEAGRIVGCRSLGQV